MAVWIGIELLALFSGQFVCGNKHCNEKDGLASYEESAFSTYLLIFYLLIEIVCCIMYVVDRQERRNWIREGAEGAKILNKSTKCRPNTVAVYDS